MREERAYHQELENALMRRRIQQVNLAQNIVRVSPMGSYQYAMEAIAGTGLPRYRHFIDQARSYAQRFEETLLTIDQADWRSLHIPFVENGLSAQKVELEQIPVFAEDLSVASLARSAVVDLVLLASLRCSPIWPRTWSGCARLLPTRGRYLLLVLRHPKFRTPFFPVALSQLVFEPLV